MPRQRSWRIVGVLLVALIALFLRVMAVTADYYGPEFTDEDCLCGQGNYRDENSSGGAGLLYCKYQKDQASGDLLHSWKSVHLRYNDTVEEAQTMISDFLTDDHLKRYIDFTPTSGNWADYGLLDRTDMSLYGYHVDYYDPDMPEASGGEPHWLQVSEAPLPEDAPSGVPSGATGSEVEKELAPLPEEVFGLPVVAIVAVGAGGAISCLGTVAIAVFIFGLGRRKNK